MASRPIDGEPKKGAGSSDDSVGALIGLALLFFAIFFFLGFKEARKQQTQPGSIALFVIFHARLVHSGDTNYLVYGPSKDPWMLDLKTNSASVDPMGDLAMLESTNPKTIAVDSSLLQIFLAGAPAALTIPELVTMVKKGGDYRKIIAQIVGAGPGFFAGDWVANRFFPLKHDDPAIMKWLRSISNDYSEIRRLSWQAIAKKSAQQITDGESAEKLHAIKRVEESLRNPKYVPTNEDFSVFAEVR
jgi:hypothetical protein